MGLDRQHEAQAETPSAAAAEAEALYAAQYEAGYAAQYEAGYEAQYEAGYEARMAASHRLFERARRTLPGGAGSSARTVKFGWSPYPPFLANGTGSHVTDVEGNDYVDYLLGLGPMLLGHRHPKVTEAVARAIRDLGTCFGLPYELELEAAEKVVEAVPGIDEVRFTNSGSEAVGTAIRLARAYTERKIVVRFEGHYHGWQDTIYWSNHVDLAEAGPATRPSAVPSGPGVPAELRDTLAVLSWNDPESFRRLMRERGHEVAAVITEPVMLNTGCILPQPGYLELLRSETQQAGALLIFDEVITGFRFCKGGAQQYYGVLPDLTTLAKGLGGGFPVAAIGGSHAVMEMIGDGRYSHSGTYNSNTVQCAAVSATMDVLSEEGLYERQCGIGDRLAAGLEDIAGSHGIPVQVVGLGTVFQIWFSQQPINNWREAAASADTERFKEWFREMFSRGVLFHPSQFENLFVSLVHTEADIERTLEAADQAMAQIAGRSLEASGRL